MKRRIKDELINKTVVETVVLTVIAAIFLKIYQNYDYLPTVLDAPKALTTFSVILLVLAAAVGFLAYKKGDRFYFRYVAYGLFYSIFGFIIVQSMNVQLFYVVWAITAALILFSIFYTTYRIMKV